MILSYSDWSIKLLNVRIGIFVPSTDIFARSSKFTFVTTTSASFGMSATATCLISGFNPISSNFFLRIVTPIAEDPIPASQAKITLFNFWILASAVAVSVGVSSSSSCLNAFNTIAAPANEIANDPKYAIVFTNIHAFGVIM